MSQKHNIGSTDFSVYIDNGVARVYQSTHNFNARGKTVFDLPSGKSVKEWRAELRAIAESLTGTKTERTEKLKTIITLVSAT